MLEVTCKGSLLFWPITLDISCPHPYYVESDWPNRRSPICRQELYLTHGKELFTKVLTSSSSSTRTSSRSINSEFWKVGVIMQKAMMIICWCEKLNWYLSAWLHKVLWSKCVFLMVNVIEKNKKRMWYTLEKWGTSMDYSHPKSKEDCTLRLLYIICEGVQHL